MSFSIPRQYPFNPETPTGVGEFSFNRPARVKTAEQFRLANLKLFESDLHLCTVDARLEYANARLVQDLIRNISAETLSQVLSLGGLKVPNASSQLHVDFDPSSIRVDYIDDLPVVIASPTTAFEIKYDRKSDKHELDKEQKTLFGAFGYENVTGPVLILGRLSGFVDDSSERVLKESFINTDTNYVRTAEMATRIKRVRFDSPKTITTIARVT